MWLTDDFGKIIRDGGREGSARRAASVRRLILCLVTESRATFFGTITAYPCVSFGRTTLKCKDETRRPEESAAGNIVRGSRSRRGNTEIRPQGAYDRYGGASVRSYGQNSFLSAQGTRASWLAYVSWVDRFVLT